MSCTWITTARTDCNNTESAITDSVVVMTTTLAADVVHHNSTHNTAAVSESVVLSGFLSDEVTELVVDLIMNVILQITLRVFGVVCNTINIVVFASNGLDDGMTVSFFALSVNDVLWCAVYLCVRVVGMVDTIFNVKPYVRLVSIAYILSWYSSACGDCSMLLTVFIAVQKCACVAVPLTFKNTFTKRRCSIIVLCVIVVVLVWYMPIFSSLSMSEGFDRSTNSRRLRALVLPHFYEFYPIWKSVNKVILPAVSLSTVTICLIVLIIKLNQAMRFRKSMNASGNQGNVKDTSSEAKEVRVIQAVTLVAAIFVTCYIPDIVRRACEFFFVEFNHLARYGNTHRVVNQIHNIMVTINSTANIIVYLKYNSRYRQKFVSIFCPKRQ